MFIVCLGKNEPTIGFSKFWAKIFKKLIQVTEISSRSQFFGDSGDESLPQRQGMQSKVFTLWIREQFERQSHFPLHPACIDWTRIQVHKMRLQMQTH